MKSRSLQCFTAFVVAAVCCSVLGLDDPARAQDTDPLQLRDGYRMVIYGRGGVALSWEEFQKYSGRIRWEIESDKSVPAAARELLTKGRKAGASGQYDAAIEIFTEARLSAPEWEYPVYELAWAYLLSGDAASAEEWFSRLNEMAPHGFFNSQQAVDCLRREREDGVTPGTYQRLVGLERASRDTALLVLRNILDRSPEYAVGWERMSHYLTDHKEILEAIDKGLAAKPDPFTRDLLRMRKALVADANGKTADAVKMLERLLEDPNLSMPAEAQIRIAIPQMKRKLEAGTGSQG